MGDDGGALRNLAYVWSFGGDCFVVRSIVKVNLIKTFYDIFENSVIEMGRSSFC